MKTQNIPGFLLFGFITLWINSSYAVTSTKVAAVVIPLPTIAISASPASIAYNAASVLSWSSANTTSCVASGGWTGSKPVSGTFTTPVLTTTTVYTLTCTGLDGKTTVAKTASVTVAPPPPTLTLQPSPASIAYHATAALTWSSANTKSCIASGGWTGSKPVSGTFTTPVLTTATDHTLTCTGLDGKTTVAQTTRISVAAPPAPTLTLTTSPASIAVGATSVLSWSSTNTVSCLASGTWTGSQALSGTFTTAALPSSAVFILTCTGLDGKSTVAQSASVTVGGHPLPPTLTFSASSSSIAMGSTSVLTWLSTSTSSCVGAGGWRGAEALSGTFTTPALNSATIYTLTCAGLDGSTVTQNATITTTSSVVNAGSKMGINIGYVNDWGDRQLTFIDVMKQARGFASLKCPWDPVNCPVPLDANGWPTTDFGVYFITNPGDPLARPLNTTYPSMFGTYKLSFTGQATVRGYNFGLVKNQVYNSATNTTTADVIVQPTDQQVALVFLNTTNGVQNLKLLRPGYANGTSQVFTSEILNAIAPFSTIRMMEALGTNSNPATGWATRKSVTDPTQQGSLGIAWEYVIQLANASGKDVWINIPDQVNLNDMTANNYVVQLATLIKKTLKPGIHVYVEYSNELWNGMFSQTHNLTAAAVADVSSGADPTLNYDNINNQWYWGYRRAAHQTLKISQLFAGVFGSSAINNTIRPVYMSQYVQPYYTEDSLKYLNANFGAPSQYLYGIGGAPYFSPQTAYTDIAGLFASLQTGINLILPGFSGLSLYHGGIDYGAKFKSLANYYGLKTLMYEGGPDLTVNRTNQAIVESAESDVRINQVVQADLADAIGCGNDLFMYYKLASPTSDPFGAYEDLTLSTPKSIALNTVAATPLSSYNVCTATMTNQLFIQ